MLPGSFPIFRVGGIQVRIHASWFIVFVLITWSLAEGFLPQTLPGIPSVEAWAFGAVAAILMFGSVLLHELAHSLVAIRRGLDVTSITLFIFGGVSNLTAESKTPRTEFLVAIVGPLTSFVVAAVAFAVTLAPVDERLGAIAAYLAVVNALLGGFNLIPGFPLDGGRVFRSILWSATHNVRRATEIAGSVGQIAGFGFMVLGAWEFLQGNLLGGLWTAAIGWFLQSAASSSVQQLMFDQRLGGVLVRDAMTSDDLTAPPGLSVEELIETFILADRHPAVPVADNGRLVGIVTIGDVVRVAATARRSTTIAEVMTPSDRLITIAPTATLREAAELLSTHDFDQLPVVDAGRVIGLVTRADVIREFQVREALDVPAPPVAAPEPPPPDAPA